jgi:hypothetical protein
MLSCNDNYGTNLYSRLSFSVNPDGHYWIRISGNNGATGNFQMTTSGPDCRFDGDQDDNGVPDECDDPCRDQPRGDCNGDGTVNGLDIDRFVEALTNPDQFNNTYAPLMWQCVGDANCDGSMNGLDIDPFVVCLTSGCAPCP